MHKAIVIALAIVLMVTAGSPGLALAGPAGQNAPAIDGIVITSIPSWGQAYRKGDKIRVAVSFTETVTVTGAPQLALTIGSQTRQAAYDSSDTTPKALYFEYTVQSSDSDTDGISINTNALTLNGGTITSTGTLLTAELLRIPRALPAQPQHKVSGIENSVPSFAGSAGLAYEATVGTRSQHRIPTKATGGDGGLTYTLSNTGLLAPCATAPGPSGASGVGGSSESLLPGGITYAPPSATDTHGGIITVAANTAAMPATCFRLVAQDSDRLRGLDDVGMLHFSIAVLNDYDVDNDGLIDVGSLAKLNAIRWDLDGDGNVVATDVATYKSAFPNAMAGMGCLRDHDDDTATPKVAGCIGYELTRGLDFDKNNDGKIDADDDYWNGGKGWAPIGDATKPFTATFDGNGNTLSNLFIKDQTNNDRGLFGVTGTGCQVERLGLQNVNVTGYNNVGGLVGRHGCAISSSYATGSVTGRGNVGGLAGYSSGPISASYATGSVTSSYAEVGGLVGNNDGGAISTSYATGSVTSSYHNVGGLVGSNYAGAISTSYATGSVTGTANVGGLVGNNSMLGNNSATISASYAAGSVTGSSYRVGGLVGRNSATISTSYATGSVTSSYHNLVGGLVGYSSGTISASYWDTGTTGQSTSAGGTGKTSRDLQSPNGYSGIYATWNLNLDGVAGNDNPWHFGANRQYPVLNYGGLAPSQQRRTAIRSDNWNAPVVGEPVVASLDVTGATGITWQWQSSTNGSTWTDIANATSSTYLPVAADAASGGKFLRAKATFTTSGSSRTLITVNTAKVIAARTAAATTAVPGLVPVVGVGIRYDLPVTGAADHAWRWQRCDNAGMTTNCVYPAASTTATAEYTPVAGDVGKYLRAYVYYAANDAGKTWTRTETPVLGPVVAAPAASP